AGNDRRWKCQGRSAERQRWAAHAQAQALAQTQGRSREREAALQEWRMATERKCQSLGTEEWHPAVSFGRQMSQSEAERWGQEQQRLHARTPEGMVVHPRTKAKSQSLPRVLQPESLQYVDIALSGKEMFRPASANQLSITPKARFTRPPRPPSYEMHQQIRGSCEILSGRESVTPMARDRTPIPTSRSKDPQLDYFAQDSRPPGYIPPPSYKRQKILLANTVVLATAASNGHPACSWPGPHRDRSSSSQKQLYPVYSTQEYSGGGVQYISFDDPRIRHISSALGGNSLTDADKIRHIRNELPSVTVSEPAPDDSAFLPPPLGPFVSAKLAGENNQTHLNTLPSPSSPSSTIVPESGQEIQRNTKRRVSETIFCLVSVPVHTPTNINKGLAADQNNNEAMPNLTVTNTDTFAVGLKESPNIRSKSVNEIPIKSHYSHYHTTSTSSMRNYKRAPLRKEVIDAWVLQANEDKELGYGGSWPGNQYRNQETQTGSPVTGFKSPETQSPTKRQEALHSASDTTMDSASSYGYPMTGQKNLHLSSNSAFSRLNLSPTQTESLQHTQQDSSSPTKTHNQGEHQLSSPKKSSPPESEEQLVFGQFLLKPVNRRPCDAIGELETINKEMEDTISKRPNVSRFKNDSVDERLACFKSGEHFTGGPEPGREAISLPPMHIERPNNIKKRSKSFASSADLESMEMRGTFSKPQANNIPLTSKQSPLPKPTRSNNFLLSFVPPCSDSNHLYRQDIPVPQESLLRDVGLTVYTETPGGPGEPMQRSLSVPSPLNHKDHSQSVTALVRSSGSFEHNSREELDRNLKGHSKSDLSPYGGESKVCGIDRESCISPEKGNLLHTTRRTMEVSYAFRDDDNDERYALSEPLTYKNDSTIADKHLESLLIQEKANTLPTEDLSNLYEVKFAKGIPENESIEERAARILGITVPVEALCVEDKQSDDDEPEIDTALVDKQLSSNEETQQVTRAIVQVQEGSLIVQGPDMEEIKETGSRVVQEEEDRLKHTNDHNDGQQNQDTETPSVLDIPEFPPSKLPLSLPVTPDKTLSLSICSGEKKGRGGTCKLIESLQDKLNCSAASSAAASTGLTTDRMARLKELDSVSRIRRLSLKTPEPVQEPESKVVEDLTMKVCNETRENVAQQGLCLSLSFFLFVTKQTLLNSSFQVPFAECLPSFSGMPSHLFFPLLFSSDSYDPSRVERV
uniref:Junctional cadherin 5 associated a n=1 Tax=Xiphophorus couchianus TaxID=32473 RepID=A0A3B5L1C6_9TELE